MTTSTALHHLITGAIVMGYAVAGLFFARFWRQTRDRLFLIFAIAFWLLGVQRLALALTAEMLEGVGRGELARQVRHHEAAGVETYGWLPQSSSIDALADYAESQGAHLVVVPNHSDHRNLADFIRGRDTDVRGPARDG